MSKEHIKYLKKLKKEKYLIIFFQFLILATFIISWEFLSSKKIINPFIFSSPSNIIKTIRNTTSNRSYSWCIRFLRCCKEVLKNIMRSKIAKISLFFLLFFTIISIMPLNAAYNSSRPTVGDELDYLEELKERKREQENEKAKTEEEYRQTSNEIYSLIQDIERLEQEIKKATVEIAHRRKKRRNRRNIKISSNI